MHHGLYGKALKSVQEGKDLDATPIWVCAVCGNTVEGEPPDECPICGAKKEAFQKVE